MLINIAGACIQVQCDPPDQELFAHIRSDFGLFEKTHTQTETGAHIRTFSGFNSPTPFVQKIPPSALLCSHDPIRDFQWWQQDSFNYELWADEALVISNRDECSSVYCRPNTPVYPLVRAEIVRCLRAQLNHRHKTLYHGGLASGRNGQGGVLVPGVKSQGKTSTVLWLVESGLQLQSDEMVLGWVEQNAYRFCGIPRRFALTEEAIQAYFPQYQVALASAPLVAPFNGEEKHLFHLGGTPPADLPTPCIASMIILPQLWRSMHSKIEPLTPDETQSVLYGSCEFNQTPLHELEKMTRHLATTIKGYRLLVGQDSRRNFETLRAHLAAHDLIASPSNGQWS